MSVPLNEEKRSEAPLIAFTLCTPAVVGVALLAVLLGFWSCSTAACLMAASSLALATAGMLASVFHLAKPLRAPFSLRHLSSSWLSREIVAVAAFWALAAAWLTGCLIESDAMVLVNEALAAASGVVLLFVITRAYDVPTRPAWRGAEGLMELAAAACGVGSAVVLLCLFCGLAFGQAPVAAGEATNGAATLVARLAALCVAQVAALVLDVASHRARIARLKAMAPDSDERIPLTLSNYESLRPTLHRAWTVEGVAVVVTCVFCAVTAIHAFSPGATFAPGAGAGIAVGSCVAIAALQFAAHGLQRWLFYEIPVPVRYVAALRKR